MVGMVGPGGSCQSITPSAKNGEEKALEDEEIEDDEKDAFFPKK